MCEVCVAGELIELEGKRYWVSSREEAPPMRLRATAAKGEFEPYVLEVKRGDDSPLWFAGPDLAGAVGRLGVDVKWRAVDRAVKEWLAGGDDSGLIYWLTTRGHRNVSRNEAAALGLVMHDEPLEDQTEPELGSSTLAGVARKAELIGAPKRRSRKKVKAPAADNG